MAMTPLKAVQVPVVVTAVGDTAQVGKTPSFNDQNQWNLVKLGLILRTESTKSETDGQRRMGRPQRI